ncbi:cell envelope integrity protein TolA [Roseateles sp. BYS180W]|uniref:Cell envelope integrity protein TolA n=1 Tax=Roseateles rivi TaxID=3299028 RepID=A0ABW7FXZ3_9BURK
MSALASASPLDLDALRPPAQRGMARGIAFALGAHLALVLALSVATHWHSQPVVALEAELWASVPVAAAPRAQEPPPPEPAAETPKPKPAPEPEPQQLEQEQREAEIALAKAREQERKKEAERLRAERQKREKLAQEKAEREQRERAEQEARDKKALAEQRQRQAEQDRQAKARKDAENREAAQREALRQEHLKRIQGLAGASGGAEASGTALKSAGPSSNYAGRIKARIKPNIVYVVGATNPEAVVALRMAPDGTIVDSRLIKSSGDSEWDRAVLRAITKTEVLPRDTDGRVPAQLEIAFRPREL